MPLSGTRIGRSSRGGAELTQEDEDDFPATFRGRLRADQIDTLIRWHDEEIAPKLLKARRGIQG